jgi:hypothetical protein
MCPKCGGGGKKVKVFRERTWYGHEFILIVCWLCRRASFIGLEEWRNK